jgi:predicted nuclease of predicted toxin-antitoxin system
LSKIRFYFDENIPPAVEEQLQRLGIDVVSAHSLGLLGKDDHYHLEHAAELQRVLCTHDTDFLSLAQTYPDHCGIVWAAHEKASVGGWVKALTKLHATSSAEAVIGRVE